MSTEKFTAASEFNGTENQEFISEVQILKYSGLYPESDQVVPKKRDLLTVSEFGKNILINTIIAIL